MESNVCAMYPGSLKIEGQLWEQCTTDHVQRTGLQSCSMQGQCKVNVKGRSQGHGSRSMVKVKFLARSSRY